MPDRTQDLKNHRQVTLACKNYTDKEIKASEERILSIVARNNVDFIDHINEPTYRFTAPANAKLLMLQSIAGNSNKIAPSTPSDDSVARLKTIPDNTYKSQIDYIGGKTVKYNQLASVQSGTKNITAPYGIIYSFVTVDFTHKYFLNAKHSVSFDNLNINFYVAGSGNVRNQQLVGSTSIQAILNPNYNAIGNINCYCANSTDITVSYDSLELIDLTDKFGAGNEPSTVETAISLLKANGYKLDGTDTYSVGDFKHAITTSVNFLPINLCKIADRASTTTSGITYKVENGVITLNGTATETAWVSLNLEQELPKGNYVFNAFHPTTNNAILTWFRNINNEDYSYKYLTEVNSITTITDNSIKVFRFNITSGTTLNNFKIIPMIVRGSTAPSTYIPYVAPITKAIPSEVLALELNKSAGSVYDVIDCNNKAGTHKVGAYTFTGNETWVKFSNGRYYFEGFKTLIKASTLNIETTTNLTVMSSSEIYSQDNGIAVGSDGTLLIKNTTSITSTSEAQSYMAGKTIQYELKDYVPYDLSQYFNDGWNKVDLDKQYATCEMVVAEPIDMPNKVEYYGTIIHSLATAVKQDGFNVWDETWDNGYINDTTGANAGDGITSYLRSKNYIGVLPSQVIYFKLPSNGKVYYYDINQNYISYADLSNGNSKTIPTNCYFIRFWINYSGTYKHDICINISNQDLNGTYKPYKAPITRLLPNSEEKYSWGITDGVRNTRVFCDDEGNAVNEGSLVVGNQDLGTLTWDYASSIFSASKPSNSVLNTNDSVATNILCEKYTTVARDYVSSNDKSIAMKYEILIKDTAFINATIFKNAMNGETLWYQKNATSTETLDDFDYFFDCEEGDTFTLVNSENLQCYATYSFLIKEAKSNE